MNEDRERLREQYTDPETGLQYLRARYYDPTTAQFLTIDPAVATTLQPYSYISDNPTNSIDPSGDLGAPPCRWQGGCNKPGIISGFVANHPLESIGLGLGAVSLATGVGELALGGAAVAEGVLGAASAVSGVGAGVIDFHYCVHGSGIACVGAGTATVGAAAAGVAAVATIAELKAGATAIGLTFGGIGLVTDTAATANAAATNAKGLANPCG